MTQGKVAGPYEPMYPEVMDDLRKVNSYAARWLYNDLICSFNVSEEWNTSGDWIEGIIEGHSNVKMADSTGIPEAGLRRLWNLLKDAGLVEVLDDGSIRIPRYKKKGYTSMSPRELTDQLSAIRDDIEVLKKAQSDPPDGKIDQKAGKTDQESTKSDHDDRKSDHHDRKSDHHDRVTSIIGPKINKLPLSSIVDQYYEDLGEKRISTKKRERDVAIAKKLEQDGFNLEEIAYATSWTIENAKEKPYGFGLVAHTIGRAMAARQEELKKAKRRKEAQVLHDREEKRRAEEEHLRRHADLRKESLTDDERRKLRDDAMDELRSEGVPESFINDFLIERKENSIMMKEYEDEEMQVKVG